jgi:hypothetical protein
MSQNVTNANIEIVNVEKDGNDGLMVVFSDGTQCGYVVEELLALRPSREEVNQSTSPDIPRT